MFKSLQARFAVIAAVLLLCGWMLAQRGVTLGLDLRGGTHLALEVSDPAGALTAEQRSDAIDRALRVIRTRIDELGVAEPVIQKVGQDRLVVELPGATQDDQRRAKDVIQRAAFLQFQIVRPLSDLEGALPRMDRALAQAFPAGAPARDVPEQPATTGVGGLFATPGADTVAGEETDTAAAVAATAPVAPALSGLLMPTGQIGQMWVARENIAAVEQYLATPAVQQLMPRGVQFRWGMEPAAGSPDQGGRLLYLVESRAMMTGEYLEDAQAQRDPQFGQPEVTFTLSRQGGRIFERATSAHVGDAMAIVLDERVISAPVIQTQIGMNGRITLGGGSIEEARDLALVLRAGALPAPIEIVEERSVGPSLGADSIEKGQFAGMIGISLVILIMLVYYKFSGLMAVVALTMYVVFLLGGLAGIGATLTLPGIAGIVLSIGMAVDANVLIFERIREELVAGRTPRMAVNEGFGNALSAIVDSQLTTLLTALVLFQFGTGPVRGFAVTLGIGIIASLFTAIFVTRTFFMLYLDRRAAAQGVSI
jgi:protein-export membrane protein SecD